MTDRECMTSHSGEIGRRNASSTRSTHLSGDDVSSVGCQLKIQRDTLYVSGSPAGAALSEWIVSYSSTDGPEARSASRGIDIISSDTGHKATLLLCDDLDLSDPRFFDPFCVSRLLASRFLSGGRQQGKFVRLFSCLARPLEILAGVYGVLLCSNILDLTLTFSKLQQDSGDVVFLVSQQDDHSRASSEVLLTDFSSIAEDTQLVSYFISQFAQECLGKLNTCILNIPSEDRVLLAALRAVATLSCEMMPRRSCSLSVQIVALPLLRLSVSSGDFEVFEILKIPKKLLDFVNEDISLHVGDTFFVIELTSAVLRLFMAGYCSVRLIGASSSEPQLYELFLIVNKYFAFSVRIEKNDTVQLVRKCQTIETRQENLDTNIPESKKIYVSLTSVLSEILAIRKPSTVLVYCLERCSEKLMDLVRGVAQTVGAETSFQLSSDKSSLCQVSVCVPDSVDWARIEVETTTRQETPEETAPPVDLTIDGPDWEARLEEMEAKLNNGWEDESNGHRLSVLLVEKKLTGLGIWAIAQMSTHMEDNGWGLFELISERAMRGSENGTVLKNSVRLFIKRVKPVSGSVVARCEKILVEGNESRITLATDLFAALNTASNGYVVMESSTKHCAFLALMSVIIVNGWSRSIMQRVETRVFTVVDNEDEEKALFLLRLVQRGE